MAPILFSLDRRVFYSYTAVLLLFLLAILLWLAWQERRYRDGRLDAALWSLVAAMLGARLVHIIANWNYYGENPGDMFALAGGLSFSGGLLAGLAGLALYAARPARSMAEAGQRFLAWLGVLLFPLALGLVGGWLACLLGGCAYGKPLPPPQRFYTFDWPDLYGVHAFRLPSQLLGLLLSSALLLAAARLAARPGFFLILLGLGSFLIGFTRGDQQIRWGPFWASQWGDLVIAALGLTLLRLQSRWQRREIAPSGDQDVHSTISVRRQVCS